MKNYLLLLLLLLLDEKSFRKEKNPGIKTNLHAQACAFKKQSIHSLANIDFCEKRKKEKKLLFVSVRDFVTTQKDQIKQKKFERRRPSS